MIFGERSSSDESIVGFKIFSEFNKVIGFPPEFYVSIDAESDDEVGFRGGDDIVDDVSMHVADFVEFGSGKAIEEEIVVFD